MGAHDNCRAEDPKGRAFKPARHPSGASGPPQSGVSPSRRLDIPPQAKVTGVNYP